MELKYQDRCGTGNLVPTTGDVECRLTVAAREALEAVGATVELIGKTEHIGAPLYRVRLRPDRRVPEGIVACCTIGEIGLALRLVDEPAYPGEVADYWNTLDFTPCPECGRPLIWYEAGYVPGYRVCTGESRHHVLAR